MLVIPGLDGDPGLVRAAAPRLFRDMRVLPFDHLLDPMAGGIEGLAERALAVLDADSEADTPRLSAASPSAAPRPLLLRIAHALVSAA